MELPALPRPFPVPDTLSEDFWRATCAERLVVQRCARCETYQHPAQLFCFACSSQDLAFEEVSGRGTVYSFTQTCTGARHPYWQEQSPYLLGVVELEEQERLFMFSNFPGSAVEDMQVGLTVRVEFMDLDDSPYKLPQFRLVQED